MSILFESNYGVPSGDKPLNFARIAHVGNWHTGGTITASTEATDFPKEAADNTLTYEKWQPTALPATWQNDLGSAKTVDYCCIAAHNMGTQGNTLSIEYDSTGGGSWVSVVSEAITDDSPIFAIFTPQTFQKWRLNISNGSVPSIGVVKFGQALQMERPFYTGHAPTRMRRRTTTAGNMSEGGEFLGRTRIRSSLTSEYSWANLSYAWVRENLDGASGLIQSLELEPFFLAWRANVTQDCDFGWTQGPLDAPVISGPRDLMSFNFSAEVLGYE